MKDKTKIAFTLGAVCAGAGVYLYMKNKQKLGKFEVFSQDFFDDIKDGVIQEEDDAYKALDEDFIL